MSLFKKKSAEKMVSCPVCNGRERECILCAGTGRVTEGEARTIRADDHRHKGRGDGWYLDAYAGKDGKR